MDSSELRASQVDPRDVQVEDESPVYRVYFEDQGGATDEYRITGAADVHAVLNWGQEHATGRSFQLFLETDTAAGRRLSLLAEER